MLRELLFLYAIVSAMTGYAQMEVEECVYDTYLYLNAIRQTPSAYSKKIGVDLSGVEPRPALKWNDALIKAAQAKAEDMAKRKYLAHVDKEGNGMNIKIHAAGYEMPNEWYEDPTLNNFESLGGGNDISSGESIIDMLIVDEGSSSLGHRKHLLGMTAFWANCCDIGIGHAYRPKSKYKHYWCILIAKHDY